MQTAPKAPTTKAPKAPATKAPARDPLADFRVATPKTGGYVIAEGAKRARVPAISDTAEVTRGARVTRKGDSVPMLLVKDGSSYRALELSAVGAAIAGGVVTKDEISALLGA